MNTSHTIDAAEKSMGRVASEAAKFLIGKHDTSFARNVAPNVKVTITNASKVNLTEKKRTERSHERYTGYPGGLRTETLEEVIEKKGYEELFRHAVYGMLPANRLRSHMMNNLTIVE
jgi:large subunit ribosomal protein L13|tara:strand:+ start:56901 stop:57251 length:351 start_codon:yes stop_codon:yes gene_type:complete